MIRKLVMTGAFAGALTAAAGAQTPPSCNGMAHRGDFDFWVGEWNVYSPDGTLAGTNSIRKTQGGCLIEEHWSGASGSEGFSMNFYDPLTGQWRQVWMSSGIFIDYSGGLDADGAMALEGEIHYHANDQRFGFRGVWTLNEDGSVTQHFTQFDAAEEVWTDWFIGRYVHQEDDPNTQSGE
ncbi:hypothetical protein [Hyphobacterium sp.]|uniref:hypothetical protein n=1 Tax=Hyphobacterium sp. TaxID=2004662 RepID=UPI003BAC2580